MVLIKTITQLEKEKQDREAVAAARAPPKKFFAVRRGRVPGVYLTWADVFRQVRLDCQ